MASCSSRMNGVSGRTDHYDTDAYQVSGGFESDRERITVSDRALRPLEERYEGETDRSQRDEDAVESVSVSDYRRAYRQGYQDGNLDASLLPGLYRPNYGGWGWGIGPGIGWNAPCWSWGARWNYFSYWNNPWNDPWGPSWGWGGWNNWHYGPGWGGWGYGGWGNGGWGNGGWGYGGWGSGGWNHVGWGGWNGWGGNPYVRVHRGPNTWAGPRRDRLNRVHTTTPRNNRWTPWGQSASNNRPVRETRVAGVTSAPNRTGSWSNRTTAAATDETRRPLQAETRYGGNVESGNRTRSTFSTPSKVYTEPRTYTAPRSEPRTYTAPRTEPRSYTAPRSEPRSYTAPRSEPRTYTAPRSTPRTYTAPRSEPRSYTAPRSEPRSYSAPRSEPRSYTAPRSEPRSYTAPRSSSSSGSGSGSSRSTPSSSGRSGSHSPRR
jgi:hypothetical protein